jgi:hypothetical protein
VRVFGRYVTVWKSKKKSLDYFDLNFRYDISLVVLLVDKVAQNQWTTIKITRETEIPAPSPGYLVPLVQLTIEHNIFYLYIMKKQDLTARGKTPLIS